MNPTVPQLWDYQAEGVQAAREAFASGLDRVLLVAPTGAGKTTVFSYIISRAATLQRRCCVVAHRRELIDQASRRLDLYGIDHGIVMANHWRHRPLASVQVASIDTLRNRHNLGLFEFIVVDEAHHAAANSYLGFIGRNPAAKVLGVTATPYRADGRGLGDLFQTMLVMAQPRDLVERGFLVPPRIFAPSAPDLDGVSTRGGDFDQDELEQRCDQAKIIGDVVEHWMKLARGRPTLAFAVSIRHSHHIVEAFREAGIAAAHIDANTPKDERQARQVALAAGQLQVLSNVGIMTEGTDIPAVSCIIHARPTKSLGLYIQITGRGLRRHGEKRDCIVLDHAGLVHQHGTPLDDIEADLATGIKKRKKKAEEDPMLGNKRCLECYAIYAPHHSQCPECGWTPLGRQVKHVAGELSEIDLEAARRARVKEERAASKSLADLIELAARRGYNPRWAEYRWRAVQAKRASFGR